MISKISKMPKDLKKQERECFVYIVLPGETDFVTAGRFTLSSENTQNIGKFVYGKTYLARINSVELDPLQLKLDQKIFETFDLNGFFGAIRDSMPDFWGRQVIDQHLQKTGLEDFDYLMHGPDDRAGALGFGFETSPPPPRKNFNQTLELKALQIMAESISAGIPIENSKIHQIQGLLLNGTSMGGARPKAVVEDKENLWIAKFSSPQDRWNQPLVEHAFLKLAKTCELQVAESKIVSVSQKDVLLVRRFDRDKAENGYLRHRMLSALTCLNSDDSPSAKDNWSYLAFADEIRRLSTHPKADLKELFARMCFNAAISNLDDHPRNHAILGKKEGWRLSPAYDLTPTPAISEDARFLAMSCGLEGRIARRKNLLSGHHRFLLSEEEASQILNQIIETIQREWEPCLRQAGVSQKDLNFIESAKVYPGFFYTS
jgi:serine/threonine-protein kinase HipA